MRIRNAGSVQRAPRRLSYTAIRPGHRLKLVYLAQVEDDDLLARHAADNLGLEFEHRVTGYGDLERVLVTLGGAA
ncbi:MAG: hypothetical protein BMS9Abin01_1424 [Gammaproteobacteria bacterium]|nr:MAG: hypothetical protein BMS9Abin01_1424 [Gammaproteobacteria bacterium]